MTKRPNRAWVEGQTLKIQLNHNLVATVDLQDAGLVEGRYWGAKKGPNSRTWYATSSKGHGKGRTTTYMHHERIAIMG